MTMVLWKRASVYNKPIVMQREEEGPRGLLDVYIRNNNKQALLVHSPPNANLAHISTLVATRFRVPPAEQLLFYNGQQVGGTLVGELRVADRAVIHLVDRRNLTENVVINVRRLRMAAAEQFRVPASQIIEDFLVRHMRQMEADRPFLVYTGRELDPRRSFAEEFVENESEIFCLDEVKDQLVGERRAKYERRLREIKREKEVRMKPKESEKGRTKLANNETIKEAQQCEEATVSVSVSGTRREEREEVPTPNFKKKNMSGEVSAVAGELPALQVPSSHENSTSLVTDHFQENRSTLTPNPFFNEGSSISSICSEENHNPESSKRLDQPSVMFNSAYMGLTDNPTASRPGSIIANPDQEDEQEVPSRSISFDTRAPELVPADRHLTALDREEIMEESKEDYSESRESGGQREEGRDLSGYELESIEHHQLSASVQLEVEMFDNRAESPPRAKDKREILIEEEGHSDLGVDIQPIAYSHHQIQSHQPTPSSSPIHPPSESHEDIMLETPHFDEGHWGGSGRRVEVLVVEHSQLAQGTESQMAEEKEDRKTNRHSNFHSSNSSRARQYDINNEYNFGQFQRFNRNRFSGYREAPNESDAQSSKSEEERSADSYHPQEQQYLQVEEGQSGKGSKEKSRKGSVEDEHSLNIVQLPIEARIKENSSLLIDCESKSELSNRPPPIRGLQRQESGIDELNKLLQSEPHSDPSKHTPSSSSNEREGLELVRHEHDHPGEEVIETSLNMRMSGLHSGSGEGSSPVVIKEVRGMESEESLEKVEVKNSLPYFSSYTRSISSQMRFTNHREVYSIGDFVFNCELAPLDPLAFFVEALARQDALDVYRSYP